METGGLFRGGQWPQARVGRWSWRIPSIFPTIAGKGRRSGHGIGGTASDDLSQHCSIKVRLVKVIIPQRSTADSPSLQATKDFEVCYGMMYAPTARLRCSHPRLGGVTKSRYYYSMQTNPQTLVCNTLL